MGTWEPSSGASDEWYTPKYVFDALCTVFDLDVAPARHGTGCVPAARVCFGDGLTEDWSGFVWMNPPFGGRNAIAPWLDKFIAHGNGIALTPDRTSAPWFQSAWRRADLVMFLPKVKFVRPDGSLGKQPGNGTALWAKGARGIQALKRAEMAGLGTLALPLTIGSLVPIETPFTASAHPRADLNAASGLTPAGGTPQPHQISGDLAEAERACAPGGALFTHDHSNTPGDIQNHGA